MIFCGVSLTKVFIPGTVQYSNRIFSETRRASTASLSSLDNKTSRCQ